MTEKKHPRSRTSISTKSLPAVQAPPTRIEDGSNPRMTLDPEKVISAWLQSAEVLKDVAKAIRENQEDNDHIRTVMTKNRRLNIAMTGINLCAVVFVIFSFYMAKQEVDQMVKKQATVSAQIASEAAGIRKQSQLLNQAVSAALEASVAQQGSGDAASKERSMLEAQITVAAVQAKMADSPHEEARAQKKVISAISRAKKRSSVIGPVSVDPQLIRDF